MKYQYFHQPRITNGDTAIFQYGTCYAKGISNISVRWMFNGSSCGFDSCEQNGISIKNTQNTDSNSFVINTTLEIRTGELHSVIMDKKNLHYSVYSRTKSGPHTNEWNYKCYCYIQYTKLCLHKSYINVLLNYMYLLLAI